MSLSVFYYCICACLRRRRSFNPSLCRLSPFHLSYVAVSRQCRLSEFTLTGHHCCRNLRKGVFLTSWLAAFCLEFIVAGRNIKGRR